MRNYISKAIKPRILARAATPDEMRRSADTAGRFWPAAKSSGEAKSARWELRRLDGRIRQK